MKKAKRKSVSPTKQVLKVFRQAGYSVAITERWNSFARIRQDLFGFIDLIAIKPGEPVIAIQATSRPNVSSRVKKIVEIPDHAVWLQAGGRILVVGFPRVVEIKLKE